jgi:hypothetical protein
VAFDDCVGEAERKRSDVKIEIPGGLGGLRLIAGKSALGRQLNPLARNVTIVADASIYTMGLKQHA